MNIQIKERILNNINNTPLLFALKHNAISIGELLISSGADINVKNIIDQNII